MVKGRRAARAGRPQARTCLFSPQLDAATAVPVPKRRDAAPLHVGHVGSVSILGCPSSLMIDQGDGTVGGRDKSGNSSCWPLDHPHGKSRSCLLPRGRQSTDRQRRAAFPGVSA